MKLDWKNLVRQAAPVLGSALGGPFAGAATKAIANGLLGNPEAGEDDIAKALASGDLETLAKLKEIETSFKAKMRELDIDEQTLAYKDKADARRRDEAVRDSMPAIICVSLTIIITLVIYFLFKLNVPEANQALVFSLVGAVSTAWVASVQFFVGTTLGSSKKNDWVKAAKQL